MTLPVVPQNTLDIRPINWQGLSHDLLRPGELEIIVALVRSTAHLVVAEIGLANGRTAKALMRELPALELYIGIDCGPDYQPSIADQSRERATSPGYMAYHDARFCLWTPPRGSLDLTPEHFLESVDAIFVDGDHSAVAVKHDTTLARGVTAPGGIIIWHDYGNPHVEVTEVLEAEQRAGRDIRHVADTWLAFERIPGANIHA